MEGFMICSGGQPVDIDLANDLIDGLFLNNSHPVFSDADDAKNVATSWLVLHGSDMTLEIRKVTVGMGDVHERVKLDEADSDG